MVDAREMKRYFVITDMNIKDAKVHILCIQMVCIRVYTVAVNKDLNAMVAKRFTLRNN